MMRQRRSKKSNNRQRTAIGAAAALVAATYGAVAVDTARLRAAPPSSSSSSTPAESAVAFAPFARGVGRDEREGDDRRHWRRRHRRRQQEECAVDEEGSCPAGSFCRLDPGSCDALLGTCDETALDSCVEIYDPVCGCDGRTYINSCLADVAGASISRLGACEAEDRRPAAGADIEPVTLGSDEPVTCIYEEKDSCPSGWFCRLNAGECRTRIAYHFGVCYEMDDSCDDVYDPVCGCDGRTYDNSCYADVAGASVAREGTCVRGDVVNDPAAGGDSAMVDLVPVAISEPLLLECAVGDGLDASPCPDGMFCQLSTGDCDADAPVHYGVCAAMAEVCPMHYAPVCGCDGKTHSNKCMAGYAGKSISYLEECLKKDPVKNDPVGGIDEPATDGSDGRFDKKTDRCAGMGKNTCRKDPKCRYFKNKGECRRKRAFEVKPLAPDDEAERTKKRPEPDGLKRPKPEGLNRPMPGRPKWSKYNGTNVDDGATGGGSPGPSKPDGPNWHKPNGPKPTHSLAGGDSLGDYVKVKPERYWPKGAHVASSNGVHECMYSSEYPKTFLKMQDSLGIDILFDTYEECCASYPCVAPEPPTFFNPMDLPLGDLLNSLMDMIPTNFLDVLTKGGFDYIPLVSSVHCSLNLWHVSAFPGGLEACTNSDADRLWATVPGNDFYGSAEECCDAEFPGEECSWMDTCADDFDFEDGPWVGTIDGPPPVLRMEPMHDETLDELLNDIDPAPLPSEDPELIWEGTEATATPPFVPQSVEGPVTQFDATVPVMSGTFPVPVDREADLSSEALPEEDAADRQEPVQETMLDHLLNEIVPEPLPMGGPAMLSEGTDATGTPPFVPQSVEGPVMQFDATVPVMSGTFPVLPETAKAVPSSSGAFEKVAPAPEHLVAEPKRPVPEKVAPATEVLVAEPKRPVPEKAVPAPEYLVAEPKRPVPEKSAPEYLVAEPKRPVPEKPAPATEVLVAEPKRPVPEKAVPAPEYLVAEPKRPVPEKSAPEYLVAEPKRPPPEEAAPAPEYLVAEPKRPVPDAGKYHY